jgi:hypothetical protein
MQAAKLELAVMTVMPAMLMRQVQQQEMAKCMIQRMQLMVRMGRQKQTALLLMVRVRQAFPCNSELWP